MSAGTWKVDKYEYITYEEFDKACSHFRRVLSDAGVGKDDKVISCMPILLLS